MMARRIEVDTEVVWRLPSVQAACDEVRQYVRLDPRGKWRTSFGACWNAFHSGVDPRPDRLLDGNPDVPALAKALRGYLAEFGMDRGRVGLADEHSVAGILRTLQSDPSFGSLSAKGIGSLTAADRADFLAVTNVLAALATSARKITVVTKALMAIWGQTPGFDSNVRCAAGAHANRSIPNTAGTPGLELVWLFVLGLAEFLRNEEGTVWLAGVQEGTRSMFNHENMSRMVAGRLVDIVLFPIGSRMRHRR